MDWRCWTREIVNFIHLNIQRLRDIVPKKFKMRIFQQLKYVVTGTCIKIINTEDIATMS